MRAIELGLRRIRKIVNQFFGSSLAFGFAPESGTISNSTWRLRTIAPSSIDVVRPSRGFA